MAPVAASDARHRTSTNESDHEIARLSEQACANNARSVIPPVTERNNAKIENCGRARKVESTAVLIVSLPRESATCVKPNGRTETIWRAVRAVFQGREGLRKQA